MAPRISGTYRRSVHSPVRDEDIVFVTGDGLVFSDVPLTADADEMSYISNLEPVPIDGDNGQQD
jgi:hypothetical protein